MTLPQTQSSLLQVATMEQQLAQERQTVQRLDGTATQLQQEIDNQRSSLEEQGLYHLLGRRPPHDSSLQGAMWAETLLVGNNILWLLESYHLAKQRRCIRSRPYLPPAGQQAEQELERARAEAESALQSARDDAAQAQQRVQQLEDDLSQMRSSTESLQQVQAWPAVRKSLGWLLIWTQQLHNWMVQTAERCTCLSTMPQELEAAKAAADEQQRSQSADAEARQQLQRMLDERAAALEVAQQVAHLSLWFLARCIWQLVQMSFVENRKSGVVYKCTPYVVGASGDRAFDG
jgi:hypothetical protein